MEEAIALDSIQAIAASFGASFDAEKIVDTVVEKDGTRYYKVRWVKYSWEPASSFIHLEHLIRSFWHQYNSNNQFQEIQDVDKKQQTMQPTPVFNHDTTNVVLNQRQDASSTSNKSIPTHLLNDLNNHVVEDLGVVSNSHHQEQQSAMEPTTFPTHQLQGVTDDTTVTTSDQQQQQNLDIISNLQTLPLPLTSDQVPTMENDETLLPVNKKQIDTSYKKRRKIPGACNICGKLFKSTTNIAAHRKLHTEAKQFECTQCGRKFRRKLHLTRHLESHAGIKSFECEICGTKFSSKWYMQAHAVIHTGAKPFECQQCGKLFNNKANLNKHNLIHANKRPFVCNLCGQTYRQSYDLKRHMSTHSDLKSFACTHCGKCFARKSYLQRHLLTHDSERKFQCTMCDRRFLQRGHLNFHFKKHHTELDDKVDDQPDELSNGNKKMNSPSIDSVEVFLNPPNSTGVASVQLDDEDSLSERSPNTADGDIERETETDSIYQEALLPGNASDKENTLEFETSCGQNENDDFII